MHTTIKSFLNHASKFDFFYEKIKKNKGIGRTKGRKVEKKKEGEEESRKLNQERKKERIERIWVEGRGRKNKSKRVGRKEK